MDRQRHLTYVLNNLAYDFQRFDLDHLISHLQTIRHHDITLIPYPFGRGISGALVRGDGVYYIVYDSLVHRIHQVHIVIHEIAHMVLNHPLQRFDEVAPGHPLARLGDDVRFRYGNPGEDPDEQEAEYFVQVFQQRVFYAERQLALMGDLAQSQWLNDYYKGMGVDV